MSKQAYVIEISIPAEKCPIRIKGRDKLIKDKIATLYLSNNTTSNDAENGVKRYGVSGGNNVVVVTDESYCKVKNEIEEYLNNRFKDTWTLKLSPLTN